VGGFIGLVGNEVNLTSVYREFFCRIIFLGRLNGVTSQTYFAILFQTELIGYRHNKIYDAKIIFFDILIQETILLYIVIIILLQ